MCVIEEVWGPQGYMDGKGMCLVSEVRGPQGFMYDEGMCVGCGIPQASWMVRVCVRDAGCGIPQDCMDGEGMCDGWWGNECMKDEGTYASSGKLTPQSTGMEI